MTPVTVVSLSGIGYVPYIITATAGANGSISPAGSVPVPPSGSQLFTIAADPGSKIVDVVVDGVSVGPVGSYLFTAVSANGHTIAATFAPVNFLDSWTWRNPLPTGHSLRRTATNGSSVHIAVGDYGTILRSTDNGVTWSMIENGGQTLNGVAFGSGTFVAVGSHGRLLTSADGLIWASRHTGTGTELQSVEFGNGTFVAVGNTQTDPVTLVPSAPVFTSPDGITWTARLQTLPLNTSMDLHDVAFGTDGSSNVFVAAGQGGYLLKSADNGVTWLLNGIAPIDPGVALPPGIGTFDFFDIHYSAATFVAVGASGQVYTSGLAANTWVQHDILSFADLKGITYNNARFITTGAGGEIWSSANGASWTQQVSGLEATQLNINSVTTAGAGFLAVGDDGHILTSIDGTAWAIPYPQEFTASTLRDIVYANGIYTAVGDVEPASGTAVILTSLSGSSWTKSAASPAVHSLRGVAFGNGQLVAVGESGIDQAGDPASRPGIVTSSDNGATWTKRQVETTPVTSLNLYGVTFGGNQFVAVGDWDIDTLDAVILTSPDGVVWTRRSNPSPDVLRKISYVNGSFIAVGGAGAVLVSTDGVTWTDHSIGFGPEFSAVAVKPGLPATLAAVGTNSAVIYRSTDDGISWTTASQTPAALPTGVLRGITFADGQFVAVGESGFIFSSPDAISWTTRMGADILPFGTRDLFSVTFGNGRFTVVGTGGAIMQSLADAAAAAQPVLSLSPPSVTLAPVEIGTTADTLFTVSNPGGTSLTVSSVSVDVNPAFSVLSNDCTTVAPGATCSFTIRYTPAFPSGSVTQAALTVVSDDPASPMLSVLKGTSRDTQPPALTLTYGPSYYTNSSSIQISGTVEPGAVVTITPAGAATAGPVVYSNGGAAWSSTVSNLVSGLNNITVTATDAAGNAALNGATITFDSVPFVRRTSDAATASLIQPLYNTAAATDIIQVRSVGVTESLLFDRPDVTVTLDGGYDQLFTAPATGVSVVNGPVIIRAGTVRASRITIR